MFKLATLVGAWALLATALYPRLGFAQVAPAAGAISDAREHVYPMPLGKGELRQFLYVAPANPKAVLIMFPGGTGDVGFDGDGHPCHGDNFVIRTLGLWLARDYAVLIPDPTPGLSLRGHRSTHEYAAIVGELTRFAREATHAVPIFLLGTSQGSIAAVNGGAHAIRGNVSGIVLTESVAMPGRLSQETVFSAHPALVRVPTLIVANQTDRCYVALPIYARGIKNALIHSASVQIGPVEGGQGDPNRCSSLTPHGYYGIEAEVTDLIDSWINKKLH